MGGAAAPLMVAGGIINAFGTYVGNRSKAQAEAANAYFYNEQAKFAQLAEARQERNYVQESTTQIGQQLGAYAKGGVDFSGSPMLKFAQDSDTQYRQLDAIRTEGAQRVLIARLRAQQSQDVADQMSSFGYNALTIGGSLLGSAGNVAEAMATRDKQQQLNDNNPYAKATGGISGGGYDTNYNFTGLPGDTITIPNTYVGAY